ncbi:MAG: Crp/Fnr family transcriptional regulator [Elusimicrobia bacterium]|nr:Crp/Fnr family transcriptional regulator [Elusimicrobiota bacterium]
MKVICPKCKCESFETAKRLCPMVKMPIFSGVPDSVWNVFYKKRISNDYRKGNIIFYQGNRPFGMYFMCRGRVKIVKTGSGLHSGIPRIIEAPALLGDRSFLAGESYMGTGEALEDCRICFIDGAYFEKLFLEIPQVCRAIVRRLATELGHAEEQMLDFGFKTVRGRLAKYIVEKTDAANNRAGATAKTNRNPPASCDIKLPESRGDLAKILGTAPEVLCRLLAEFRKKGWIAVSGRDVTVKDKPRLEQVSRR